MQPWDPMHVGHAALIVGALTLLLIAPATLAGPPVDKGPPEEPGPPGERGASEDRGQSEDPGPPDHAEPKGPEHQNDGDEPGAAGTTTEPTTEPTAEAKTDPAATPQTSDPLNPEPVEEAAAGPTPTSSVSSPVETDDLPATDQASQPDHASGRSQHRSAVQQAPDVEIPGAPATTPPGAWVSQGTTASRPMLDAQLPAASGGPGGSGGQGAQGAQAHPWLPSSLAAWTAPLLAAVGLAAVVGAAATWTRTTAGGTRLNPEDPAAGRAEEAKGAPSETSVPPGVPAVMEMAQAAMQAGDHERAIGWFETAIALRPSFGLAHLCLGVCLATLDRHEQALEAVTHAAELEPGDPIPAFHQARLLAEVGRAQEALVKLERVAPVLPTELVAGLLEDEAFQALLDHPRFLAVLGEL